jgi:hypothetical protein
VGEVMRLMLFSSYKDSAPVQKSKITELVAKLCPVRSVAGYIIVQAQVWLPRLN